MLKLTENKRCSNCVFCDTQANLLLEGDYKPVLHCFKDFCTKSTYTPIEWDISSNYCDQHIKNTETNFESFIKSLTEKYIRDGFPVEFSSDEEGNPAYIFKGTFWVVAYKEDDEILKNLKKVVDK